VHMHKMIRRLRLHVVKSPDYTSEAFGSSLASSYVFFKEVILI
jgi:hypothetical protein